MHGLDVVPPTGPHLTLPPGSTNGTTLGVLHRSPLPRTDVTRRQGIPVTTLARSLVDAAAAIRRIRPAGVPVPVTQHVVLDAAGAFVARLDMAWPDELVAREYDSIAFHGPDRIEADEARRQRLEALGWSVEPLHRHHLLPGEVAWLRALERDLRRRRRTAAS